MVLSSKAYHVEFTLMLNQTGGGVGGQSARGQGEVGVGDGHELRHPFVSNGRVETWPEHPQEDRTCKDQTIHLLLIGWLVSCMPPLVIPWSSASEV